MIVHATAAYEVYTHDEDGLLAVEQTEDYTYWVEELNPDAQVHAAAMFDRLADGADLAVTQYRIDLPEDLASKREEPEFSELLFEYMDTLEWDRDWAGAPIARQNAVAEKLATDVAERLRAEAEVNAVQRAILTSSVFGYVPAGPSITWSEDLAKSIIAGDHDAHTIAEKISEVKFSTPPPTSWVLSAARNAAEQLAAAPDGA